jgi:hypothetical protein
MKTLLITVLVAAFSFSAYAQQAMYTTPDIAVAGNTTRDIVFPGKSSHVYVKNDCSSDIYFNFGGKDHGSIYPLRLKNGEVFQGDVVARGIGASPTSVAATTCTFTLMLFR